jgi:hypothetical protein
MAIHIDWREQNPPQSPFSKGGSLWDRVSLFEKEGLGEISAEKAKD